jgi:hypothetical protein
LIIRSLPRSIQTQSVNVPPVSTAIRKGWVEVWDREVAIAESSETADFSTLFN